eukprot:m.603174 g.603174  ORF g.603174 m.603174 type:complete len:267 (-) comp22452_c3_seq9:1021-1821(-)
MYRRIQERLQPLMRFFFVEYFPDPLAWFDKRLAYTRSVATCSIVGYVLGIGDRHLNNILIDSTTAEMILIDFGVAFDEGKSLSTPETIPFRLTREIVDGMGIGGVEGVFRMCAEETMRVLRQSKESLLTILEVFLHDPLYNWKLDETKAGLIQSKQGAEDREDTAVAPSGATGAADGTSAQIARRSTLPSAASRSLLSNSTSMSERAASLDPPDTERNQEAERVLVQVRQKLENELSVAGQVNSLVREAMDENNLCKVYDGWQAWL